jgi:hypothetical protein
VRGFVRAHLAVDLAEFLDLLLLFRRQFLVGGGAIGSARVKHAGILCRAYRSMP